MRTLLVWLQRPGNAARLACAAGAGALLSILAPPQNLHWLHWVAYLPMFWAMREDTPRANRWLAFLYATLGVGLIFRWITVSITNFSNIPDPVAMLILVVFAVVFGLPLVVLWSAVHPLRRRLGAGWILAFPALAVALEYLTMFVFLFPYNHGVSQYRNPYTWQLASVTGVWGLTWLVYAFNAAFAEWIYRLREGRPAPVRWMAGVAIALCATLIFGAWRFQRVEAILREAPVLRVGQIQTDITMQHRLSEGRRKALQVWIDETRALNEATEPGDVDLVVWSEGASPYNVHEGRVNAILRDLIREGGYEMVVGGGTVEVDPERRDRIKAYNSLYYFGRDGEVRGRYDKTVPLPFGEYLPLADTFPILREWIRGPGDFRAGVTQNVVEGEQIRVAAPICYEAILPTVCRNFPEPDLFINITNDAWFGEGAATHQHGMLAAVRATELGVPLVRVGYTGASFVVEPHGVIHSETRPFTRVNRVVGVRMASIPTVYRQLGDWFAWLCLLGVAGAWFATRGRAEASEGD